ncbi:MAG: 23S rRNA (guanosine(2251)-2'-O)-methyltransferase RlmB [Sphingomonadales bacterium]|mgnify:CR=1 FL=1
MAYKKNKPNKILKTTHFRKKNSIKKGVFYIFGKHPVIAALSNPKREKIKLFVTEHSRSVISNFLNNHPNLKVEVKDQDFIKNLVDSDNPHQGLVLEVKSLPNPHLKDVINCDGKGKNIILVLDQITDPHNIGAIMRSAAAFNAKAIITTDRNAPPETGTLAKTASGALDILPWVRVVNLAATLDELANNGYWRVGLDGYAEKSITEIDPGDNIVLVLGSEGKGMRESTQKKCDFLAKLPISPKVESLNVSNAAAVALYELIK